MFTSSAATLQALSHAQITLLVPELAPPADSNPLLIDMLLHPFKTTTNPMAY